MRIRSLERSWVGLRAAVFLFLQDEWLECQRNWLYLESIFGAPDIQRQLPNEAKMFTQVDKSWKEIMRRVHKFPNCIKSGTHPGTLYMYIKPYLSQWLLTTLFPYKMKGSRLYYRHYLQVYWTHSRTITVCWSRFRSVWRTIWSKRDYFSLGSTFSLMMSCLKSFHRRETLRQSSPTFENASMPFPGTWKCICICICIICTRTPPILSIPQS